MEKNKKKTELAIFQGAICTLKMDSDEKNCSRSKFSSLNTGSRGSNIKYAPYAFTEQDIHTLQGSRLE